MFQNITKAKRIEFAKDKMERVLDHFLYVLELHANNDFVVYTDALSQQIPESFAANAFNVFQRGMYQIEIVRLCALWDRAEDHRENVTTVIELIDHEEVIDALAEETRRHWADQPTQLLNPATDPDLAEIERAEVREIDGRYGEEQAAKARSKLNKSIRVVRTVRSSLRLESIMNARDKNLAHSLTKTRREIHGPIKPMKNSDGHWL
ncbi:MAG: hypothetical protein WCD69_22415, partial [Xanthobacteraceae bacterium]